MTAKWIPEWASRAFFLVIFLQVPLFRVPCRTGVCSSPLQVTVGQMAASDIVAPIVLKALLYPGALVHHIYKGHSPAPVWANLLQEYNLTEFQPASPAYNFRLEIVAGCYFAVGGAVVSLIKPGRMSVFGVLLIVWGLMKDGMFGRPENISDDPANLVHVGVLLFFALALAVLSVRYDMKKVQRLAAPISKPLSSSTKAKLKTK